MLIKDRLQRINDSIFFSNICSYFFDIDGLFCVLKMFFKEFSNNSISEVSFDNEFSNSVFSTSSEYVEKGSVRVSVFIGTHLM